VVEESLKGKDREITRLREEMDAMKRREEARAPFDDKMTELMTRLLANPEIKELIQKELEGVKGEKP